MSKITREDIGTQHAKITVVLEPADYQDKYNSEVKKASKQANVKGFRKGKVPASFIKKTYGEQMLADIVFEQISKDLNKYFEDEKIELVGSPIPFDPTQRVSISPMSLIDYTIAYEIGFLEDKEIAGISKKKSFEVYDVEVPTKWVEDDIDRFKKQLGERTEVDEPIMEGDVFKVKAVEQEGGKAKENGIDSEFSLYFNNLTEDKKAVFDGKKKGFSTKVNIFELEEGFTDPKQVKKYFLNLEDEDTTEVGDEFEITIDSITRVFPAELNEENLKQVFGPTSDLKDEAGAREKLTSYAKEGFNQGIDNLFFTEAIDYINEKNDLALPEEFFKKWLTFENTQRGGAAPDDAAIAKEMDHYKRRTIITKLTKKFEVKVEEAPLRANMKGRLKQMMNQPMDDAFWDSMLENMLQDPKYKDFVNESINEVAMTELSKVFKEQFKIKNVNIDYDTFKEKLDDLNKRFNPTPPAAEPDAKIDDYVEGDEDDEVEEEVGEVLK